MNSSEDKSIKVEGSNNDIVINGEKMTPENFIELQKKQSKKYKQAIKRKKLKADAVKRRKVKNRAKNKVARATRKAQRK